MMVWLVRMAMLALAPVAAIAQVEKDPAYRITVNGTVVSADGIPLKGAEIIAGELRTITRDNGEFTLPGVTGGQVVLLVRRIGYQPGILEFRSDSSLKVISVLAKLVPTAVALGTIVIEGERLSLALQKNGFYKRRNLGIGTFFDEKRLARAAALSHVVRDAPGVRVENRRGGAIPLARDGTSILGPRYCAMSVMLDDVYLPWANDVGLDGIAESRDLAAIEVYRSPNIPLAVSGKVPPRKLGCGLIMLWSKIISDTATPK